MRCCDGTALGHSWPLIIHAPRAHSPLVVVIGDIAFDYTIEVNREYSLDEKVTVTNSLRAVGGTGANSASQVVALGGRSELVSAIGDDPTGVWLLQKAQNAGVGVGSVRQSIGPSTTATIVISGTERTVYVDLGVGGEVSITDWDLLESADLIYVSYAPQVVKDVVARGLGSRLVVGLEQWMVSEELLEACKKSLLVVTNEAGANALDISTQPVIAVTRGALGVELRKFGAVVDFVPAVGVDALDTTGAGDSFAGALCYSLATGETTESALLFAAAAASLSTLSRGAQSGLPSLDEVNTVLAAKHE